MAKRFTATDKWDDPWFFELDNKYKLLWIYILDKCDHAGILKVNKKMMGFCVGGKIDWNVVADIFKGRIHPLNGEKWFIPKFVEFQYGELKEESPPHRSVLATLRREGVYEFYIDYKKDSIGLVKGIDTLKDKDKEQVQVQEKEKDSNEGLHELQIIVKTKYGKIAKLQQQLTFQEAENLDNDYNRSDILEYFDQMENWKPLLTKKESVNLTVRAWLRKGIVQKKIEYKPPEKYNLPMAGDEFV